MMLTDDSILSNLTMKMLTLTLSYVPLDTKHVFRRRSSQPISWRGTEETKTNTAEANIQTEHKHTTYTTTTVSRPFFRDHPGEPVPEENFWTLWCKGRLTEADTLTIRLGATPSGLTSAHLHHPPIFFTGRMPFLPPNQQCQSTEGN